MASEREKNELMQLLEMNQKAKHLVELMKKGIVDFIFQKASTGKERKARGTLKRDIIPKEAQRKRGRPKKRPDYLVIYYDYGRHAIRSFKDELLKKILSKPYQPKENHNKDNEDKSGKDDDKKSSKK